MAKYQTRKITQQLQIMEKDDSSFFKFKLKVIFIYSGLYLKNAIIVHI